MAEAEPRYECPVCLGIKLAKLRLSDELVLDDCRRCGGIWFDQSEIPQLKKAKLQALTARVVLRDTAHVMKCHSCFAGMPVDSPRCPACSWKRVLACPTCGGELAHHDRFDIDACRSCKGAWFDNVELARIWNGRLDELMASAAGRGPGDPARGSRLPSADEGVSFFLDVLTHSPDVAFHVVDAGIDVIGAAGSVIQAGLEAPEAAASAIEGGVNVAGAVFEAIAEILGGLS